MTGGRGHERRALFALAAPLAAQQAGFTLMSTVDALMLGRYSREALAGAGVANNFLFAVTAIGMGVLMGMDTVVPQALGARRIADARRAVGAGARLAVMVGLAATVIAFSCPLVLELAGVDRAVVDEARPYTYVRAAGCVPYMLTIALRSYLAAHGRTRPLVVAMVAGNAVNATLGLVLIFGLAPLGLPPLGVTGAALATVAVQIVTAALYGFGVRALDREAGTPRPRSNAADLREIARHGGPVSGQVIAEVIVFSIATVAAARMGELPAAAHSIALNLVSLTFSLAMGLATATSVLVGHAVGAGELARARVAAFDGLTMVLAVMGTFAALFVAAPTVVAALFTEDAAVIAAASPLLQIAGVFQLSDGAQAVGAGALRGLGATRATLIGNLLGHYALGLPVMIGLGFGAGFGVTGLWWGLCAGLTGTAIYLWRQFSAACR